MDKEKTLTPKEELFVERYIQTYNGTLAIKEAGYNVANDQVASVMAYENLRKPHIRKAIEDRTNEVLVALKLDTDDILEEITKIALGDAKDVKVVMRKDKVLRKEVTTRTRDKLKALELLGKNKAMFIDKVEAPFTKEDLVFNINMVSSGKEAKEILDKEQEELEDED